jgi:tetratricopeptide (TPR) repeat protein
VQVLRAVTLEAAGRSDEAGQAFQAAWKLDAQNPAKAYYVRASDVLANYYRRLQLDASPPATMPFVTLEAIPDNLSRAPIGADWTTFEGFTLLRAGRYTEAIAALRQARGPAAKKSEDSPLAHLAHGRREEAQNHVAEARREYQAALAGTLVGRSVILVGMARLALVEGDSAAAVNALSQAVRLSPNDPNIRRELAGAHAAEGDHNAAFCELIAALIIDRRDAQAHSAIGQLYLDTGRNAEAVVAFTRALDLRPDSYEVRYALATAHTRLGNAAEAARQLDIYDRFRRDALEQRRRTIASEVGKEK